MHDPDAARGVVDRAAGEGAPGGGRGEEAEGRPRIDRDRSVAEVGESPLEPVAQSLLRLGIDQHVGTESAHESFVGMGDGVVEELLARPAQGHHPENRREVLRRLEGLRVGRGRLDEGACAAAAPRGIRVRRAGSVELALTLRIPDGAGRRAVVRRAQRVEERVALRPVVREQHDLAGDAVVAAVVQAHGDDVLGLEAQVGVRPPARHDDDRRDSAQFRRDRLLQQRPAFAAAACGGTRRGGGVRGTPHDGAERRLRSGDVDVVDLRMLGEVGAHIAAAADDPQEPGLDERCQRALEDGHQRVLRRIDLEQSDPVRRQQLVQHVEVGDGGDVAGAQHEPDAARARRIELCEPRLSSRRRGIHSRLQPDLGGVARQQQGVGGRQRRGVHHGAVAGRRAEADTVHRRASDGEGAEGVGVGVEGDDGCVRPRQPLFSPKRVPGRQALRHGCRVGPFGRDRGRRDADALQQRATLRESESAPGALPGAKGRDRGIQLVAHVLGQGGRGGGSFRCARSFCGHGVLLRSGGRARARASSLRPDETRFPETCDAMPRPVAVERQIRESSRSFDSTSAFDGSTW